MKLTVLGENIKKHRMRLNLTQAQLAEKLIVSSQAISNWERGITPPDLQNLCKLSALFHVSVDTLVGICSSSSERMMIGIDGGGTKTEFILFSENGNVLRRIMLPQSNPNDIGLEKCCSVLAEGIDLILEFAPTVSCIFAGIAGAATGDNAQNISAFLKKRYKSKRIKVASDAINVLSYNTKSPDSMALICGTGSVLFARENGTIHRVGGWGYLFDESGSAYDIGKDAIRAALGQQDGLGEKTIITDLLREELKNDMWSCLNIVYQKGKSYIASLAPIVFKAASLGDAVAKRIIEKNAEHLADLVNTAVRKYACGHDVVVGGGLIENCRDIILPLLKESVPSNINFIFPKLPPVYGACIECCRIMELNPDENFFNNFYNDYTLIRS